MVIYDASVFEENEKMNIKLFEFQSNFNLKRIKSIFSNLSSLSIFQLLNLRENYKALNYSIVEVDIQLNKIFTYPIYLMLMTIISSIIMFNTKRFKSSTLKIVIGLFFSVIIYYISNFFSVMGNTERIPLYVAIWSPLLFLIIVNSLMLVRINEK